MNEYDNMFLNHTTHLEGDYRHFIFFHFKH